MNSFYNVLKENKKIAAFNYLKTENMRKKQK